MTEDEKCYFLAIDFDEVEWIKDIAVLRDVCQETGIPIAVERSRSGKGAHVWIFFEDAISASLARKLGSGILTHAMNKRMKSPSNHTTDYYQIRIPCPRAGLET